MSKALHALVPLDGSSEAEKVFAAIRGIGAAKITLLHVPEPGAKKAYLDEAAERARANGLLKVETLTVDGAPADLICETAERIGASLIALSTHGRSGIDRLVLGSTAERVIRASTLPVLALRAGVPAPAGVLLDRVIVPLDGSETSWRAVEVLGSLVEASSARLTLTGVVECLGPAPQLGAPKAGDDIETRYLRLQEESLRRSLGASCERAKSLGFDARIEVVLGRPAEKILDVTDAMKATLIALTTRGRSGVSRWLFGSVTEQILHAATVPLLICR